MEHIIGDLKSTKMNKLRMYYGSFDASMALLTKAINDLKWGRKNIPTLYD